MIRTSYKSKVAFTLVEIMIVIAIIGVIVAIAMPAFMRARETSRARACQATLSKIDGAIKMYAAEQKLDKDDPVAVTDLVLDQGTGYLRFTPRCPSDGTYTLTTVGELPTCSIGANEGAPFAPHEIGVPVPAVGN